MQWVRLKKFHIGKTFNGFFYKSLFGTKTSKKPKSNMGTTLPAIITEVVKLKISDEKILTYFYYQKKAEIDSLLLTRQRISNYYLTSPHLTTIRLPLSWPYF